MGGARELNGGENKMIQVDPEKCKKDGLCREECPVAIIDWGKHGGFPEMIDGGEKNCLVCGHCVAVCPNGALSHKLVPLEECPTIDEKLRVDLDQVTQLLRSRRSIRNFRERPVEKEKIERLIHIARYAPTGGNLQLVHWTVFTSREAIWKMASLAIEWIRKLMETVPLASLPPYMPRIVAGWDSGKDTVLRNAPVVLIASSPKQDPNGMVNVTLALSYLELAALPMGLGTCWAGILQRALQSYEPLREMVALPEGHTNHYPMMLGYPKFRYFRLPERRPPQISWR
jgi:nitroreductase/NAD-dependent dihydropyrimidine dehydrogenase PreA subunit